MTLLWIRLIIAAAFILTGLFVVLTAMVGIYRFNYILNRMQIAASIDTMGIFMVLFGLVVLYGVDASTLKLLLIIIYFWLSGPVSSHLISKAEVETNEDLEDECELPEGGIHFEYKRHHHHDGHPDHDHEGHHDHHVEDGFLDRHVQMNRAGEEIK